MIRATIFCLLLSLSGPLTHAAEPQQFWDIRELTDTWHPEINIGGRWLKVDQLTMIEDIHERIQFAAEYPAVLVVVPGDTPNAFATILEGRPIIGINFAMLDAVGMDEPQFAALIGHELAHLKLEHGKARKKRSIPKQVASAVAGALINNPLGALAGQTLVNAADAKFSRDDERESDYLGAIWAVQAGYDAHGAVRLQGTLAAQGKKHPLPFLSSHPSSKARLAALEALADRLSPEEMPPAE